MTVEKSPLRIRLGRRAAVAIGGLTMVGVSLFMTLESLTDAVHERRAGWESYNPEQSADKFTQHILSEQQHPVNAADPKTPSEEHFDLSDKHLLGARNWAGVALISGGVVLGAALLSRAGEQRPE